MFDGLHLRARCWNRQQATQRGRGRWGRRREGKKKINLTFYNQKMSLKIRTMKIMPDLIYKFNRESKSSEFSLHSVYLLVRSQLMLCLEVVFLYDRWGQLTLAQQGYLYGWKRDVKCSHYWTESLEKKAHDVFIKASQAHVQFIKLLASRLLWIFISS